jgi:tetratricopeptide (TPR) repeat protein
MTVINTRLFHKIFLIFTAALVSVSLFVSCNHRSDSYNIISRLDEIDLLISVGDTKEAVLKLKEAEKYTYKPLDFIGIYKRYIYLGEDQAGLKLLEKAMKKHPGDGEILAVHVHYLLRHKEIDRAYEEAKGLEKTQYASLYSEALFSYALKYHLSAEELFNPSRKEKKLRKEKLKAIENGELAEDNGFYYDRRFIPFYIYAFKGSKVNQWMINAACLYMRDGDYEKAVLLMPEKMPLVRDSYFWACVLFDSSHYGESVQALNTNKGLWGQDEYSVKSIALLSDDYYILGEDQAAEDARSVLFTMDMDEKALLAYNKILPVIYLNSAIFARENDDVSHEYDRLKFLVEQFPLFEPGLASYCQLAIDSLNRPEEEALSKKLREAGLRTQAMERRDAIPEVSMEEALGRVDSAIAVEPSAEFEVLKENVYSLTHKSESQGQKQVRLWKLLEKNENGTSTYPEEIVHHGVFKLIGLNQTEDARAMFDEYLNVSYGLTLKDIGEFVLPDRFASWEYQAAAWFMKDIKISKSREIYEYIIKRFNERNPRTQHQSQNDAVINALINLAVIYEGTNRQGKALECLNEAQGRCVDGKLKAEALYRMAKIQMTQKQDPQAIQSLRYALTLDEDHNKARLLLKQLTNVY